MNKEKWSIECHFCLFILSDLLYIACILGSYASSIEWFFCLTKYLKNDNRNFYHNSTWEVENIYFDVFYAPLEG